MFIPVNVTKKIRSKRTSLIKSYDTIESLLSKTKEFEKEVEDSLAEHKIELDELDVAAITAATTCDLKTRLTRGDKYYTRMNRLVKLYSKSLNLDTLLPHYFHLGPAKHVSPAWKHWRD